MYRNQWSVSFALAITGEPRRFCRWTCQWIALIACATVPASIAHALELRGDWGAAGIGENGNFQEVTTAVKPAGTDDYLKGLSATTELVEREPFDLVFLDEFNNKARMEVVPLLNPPSKPLPTEGVLVFEFIDNSVDLYEVPWKNVVDYKTYRDLLLEEAEQLIKEEKYARAYRNLLYVYDRGNSKDVALQTKIRTVLFQDAKANYDRGEFGLALSIFEDVYRRDPNFQAPGFNIRSIDLILDCYDRIIKQKVTEEDFEGIRGLLQALQKRYEAAAEGLLSRWQQQLVELNAQTRQLAEQQLLQQDYRSARISARKAMNVLPDDAESVAVYNRVLTAKPQVFVGVSQPARHPDPNRLEDWASRRVGRLTQRRIIELTGLSDEGGRYEFLNGKLKPMDEVGLHYQFIIDNARPEFAVPTITPYELASKLLLKADPNTPDYSPAWAKVVESIGVLNDTTVDIKLKIPFVRPEALLHFPYGDQSSPEEAANGPYVIADQTDEYSVFRVNPRYPLDAGRQFPELVEWLYSSPSEAVDALIRGEIDVVDRISAIDLPRLRRYRDIEFRSYLVPTVHMLVPHVRNEFTSDMTFRGGLMKAINRELILRGMLQGGRQNSGMELLDGPFPLGTEENDYIGYGYDTRVAPIMFNEILAKVLIQVVVLTKRNALIKQGVENPQVNIPELVLAHPRGEVASVACQAIASMWAQAGVKTRLRPLDPGQTVPPDEDYDFLYVEIAMNEPLSEAGFLFGPKGLVANLSATSEQTMRLVQVSSSWRLASTNLRQLHRQLINEMAILPLYQMREFYAYRANTKNIGRDLMYLYQMVDQWRIEPLATGESDQ